MLEGMHESRIAHGILKLFENTKEPTVLLFYETYRAIFSPGKVKTVEVVEVNGNPTLVRVNKEQGIAYLKNTYQFVTKQEATEILQDWAREEE